MSTSQYTVTEIENDDNINVKLDVNIPKTIYQAFQSVCALNNIEFGNWLVESLFTSLSAEIECGFENILSEIGDKLRPYLQ